MNNSKKEVIFLLGYLSVSLIYCTTYLALTVKDRLTFIDRINVKNVTYLSYDDNNDGSIDRIINYSVFCAGPRLPSGPFRMTYTTKNKNFDTLVRLFEKKTY